MTSFRRSVMLSFAFLAACSTAAQAVEVTMFRDAGCGCCLKWAAHFEKGMETEVKAVDSPDMMEVKARHGVPQDLLSCHTAIVDGYVIEGHVPAEAVKLLLKERPAGVRGLAVAGMPLGSPGMEVPGREQTYDVVAFGEKGASVFARFEGGRLIAR
ncbi:DUF411 domain-containing protein [Sphingomicrobium lutaoense]|uniref:Metal-binding protein n=1 Tax=Sphingomicrobium lutaoense TaxID=515949 RepID=A0A839Z1W7_9SPHN|nr:DUF411 domain-containing protein [Sphingomicrobium lutaoense]MBB3763585.1 hypothetical protein [Sphingomicrobium lutaoense]